MLLSIQNTHYDRNLLFWKFYLMKVVIFSIYRKTVNCHDEKQKLFVIRTDHSYRSVEDLSRSATAHGTVKSLAGHLLFTILSQV